MFLFIYLLRRVMLHVTHICYSTSFSLFIHHCCYWFWTKELFPLGELGNASGKGELVHSVSCSSTRLCKEKETKLFLGFVFILRISNTLCYNLGTEPCTCRSIKIIKYTLFLHVLSWFYKLKLSKLIIIFIIILICLCRTSQKGSFSKGIIK